mmetsp:Transcript_23748/g.52243  ORF Transcript_23748/g.52243 Transcript_23748/m.52243 type:complete len:645 (-) Transcript_23748:109-2043(-)
MAEDSRSIAIVHPDCLRGFFGLTCDPTSLGVANQGDPHVFHRVLGCDSGTPAPQADVFDAVAKDAVTRAFAAGKNTLFCAMGPTGSGKSFAVTGGGAHFDLRGLIPRTISAVFSEMQTRQTNGGSRYTIGVSFVELYRGYCYDLLAKGRTKVELNKGARGAVGAGMFRDLTVRNIESEPAGYEALFLADESRVFNSLPENRETSRSHVLCEITVTDSLTRATASLSFLDFAARPKVTDAAQTFIDTTLEHLEQVLAALPDAEDASSKEMLFANRSALCSVLQPVLQDPSSASVMVVSSVKCTGTNGSESEWWLRLADYFVRATGMPRPSADNVRKTKDISNTSLLSENREVLDNKLQKQPVVALGPEVVGDKARAAPQPADKIQDFPTPSFGVAQDNPSESSGANLKSTQNSLATTLGRTADLGNLGNEQPTRVSGSPFTRASLTSTSNRSTIGRQASNTTAVPILVRPPASRVPGAARSTTPLAFPPGRASPNTPVMTRKALSPTISWRASGTTQVQFTTAAMGRRDRPPMPPGPLRAFSPTAVRAATPTLPRSSSASLRPVGPGDKPMLAHSSSAQRIGSRTPVPERFAGVATPPRARVLAGVPTQALGPAPLAGPQRWVTPPSQRPMISVPGPMIRGYARR